MRKGGRGSVRTGKEVKKGEKGEKGRDGRGKERGKGK
jgi:hypothetical protein